jgi:sec-independent protein translocase protein TatC
MIAFFKAFDSPVMKFMPGVEGTFELYTRMLMGMIVAFQMPTLVFSLTKMRLVTARFLWRQIKYAVLAIFVIAAFLTPSPDPWNQAVFAAPMLILYLISIGIAWMVEPRSAEARSRRVGANAVGWLVAAAAFSQVRRRGDATAP